MKLIVCKQKMYSNVSKQRMMHSGHSLVNKKTTTEGEILDYLWTGYVTEIRCLTKCKFKQNIRK